MHDFINDLYNYISEDMSSLRKDPEYERAVQAYMEVEAEVKEKIGTDLLGRYQQAENEVFHLGNLKVFRHSLRFGAQFALEVLDQS